MKHYVGFVIEIDRNEYLEKDGSRLQSKHWRVIELDDKIYVVPVVPTGTVGYFTEITDIDVCDFKQVYKHTVELHEEHFDSAVCKFGDLKFN